MDADSSYFPDSLLWDDLNWIFLVAVPDHYSYQGKSPRSTLLAGPDIVYNIPAYWGSGRNCWSLFPVDKTGTRLVYFNG